MVEAERGIKAASAIVDGEVVAVDEQGRTSFQALQNRSARNPPRIVYYAFDLALAKRQGPANDAP